MDIFTALESMNENDTINDTDMTDALLDLVSDSDSISELNSQFAEFTQMDEYIVQSIASVESLITTIEQNGICKSTVMVADPFGEFQSRSILPQATSLNDVPTNDENSIAAIEGLKEMAKKFWDAIKNFFKKIKDFVVNLFRKFTNVFLNFKKIGEKYKKIFEGISTLDEDKLKKQTVSFIDNNMKKLIYDDKEYVSSMTTTTPALSESGFKVVQEVMAILDGKDVTSQKIAMVKKKYTDMLTTFKTSVTAGSDKFKMFGYKVEGSTYDDLTIEVDSSAIEINKPSDTSLEKVLKTPAEAIDFAKYLISSGTLIKVNEVFQKNYTKASDSVIKIAEKLGNSEFTSEQKELIAILKKTLKVLLMLNKGITNLSIKSCKLIIPILAKAASCGKK